MRACSRAVTGYEGEAAWLLLAVLCVAVLAPGIVWASGQTGGEAEYCLSCHAKQGPVKRFGNGETIGATIDAAKFKQSVHRILDCSGCHEEFSRELHPDRSFRSTEQYRAKASRSCRRCHRDDELRLKSVHQDLLDREIAGKASVCADCHGAHEVMPVSGGKVYATEEKYCLGCHKTGVNMAFHDGTSLRLDVDTASLGLSAHRGLNCSDCHVGFSSEEHPRRAFRSFREFLIASSEVCKRCHFDKYTKTVESIHYKQLSMGHLEAPACVDCHGGHNIERTGRDRLSPPRKCQKCHAPIFAIYAKSIHGNALFAEDNRDVPTCIDCHTPHSVQDPSSVEFHERIPEMCSNCHASKDVMGKYGLSTGVVKTYLSDFHGVTMELYSKEKDQFKPPRPIAVCTDCHGTHDIARAAGKDSTVVKANLLERCRACHQDATENFPKTWLSHYEPSLANAPLVFIVNWAYRILMPIMVIGLLLQVFLHIWRYLVNR